MKPFIPGITLLLVTPLAAQIRLQPSRIQAPSAIVMDADTGRILWRKNAFQRRAMASTTKMMTAICARDFTRLPGRHPLHKGIRSVFRVSSAAQNFTPSSAMLVAGDRLTLRDLLYGLLLPSGNDAANVIAEGCLGSRSAFVDYMNARARGLRLNDTKFRNAHGLDRSGHYSTAYDLARLGREVLEDAELRRIILTPTYTTRSANGRTYTWRMTNRIVRDASYPGAIGIKTGTTDNAGECLVAAARRGGRTVISVVLGNRRGSGLRYVDTPILLDHGFDVLFHRMPNPIVRADFNGDGYPDVAIGMPQATVAGRREAGKVAVLFGGRFGLNARNPRFLHQDSPGVAGGAEVGDRFGASLAVGNLNEDRYADLAIGVPGEDIGSKRDAGAIHVVYGTRTGPNPLFRGQIFYGDQAALPMASRAGDGLGHALAAGDFDRDGRDDLAIGIPGYDRASRFFGTDAGAVLTIHGGATRVALDSRSQLFGRRTAFAAGNRFGTTLHAADFNRDGRCDLAVGMPFAQLTRGAVDIVEGGSGGIALSSRFTLRGPTPQVGDHYGFALTSGDFNGDGRRDLVVGAPGVSIDGAIAAGAVSVHFASSSGLRSLAATRRFTGDSAGLSGSANASDRFGQAVVAGDFDSDGRFDLAIGIPGADATNRINTGAVVILRGAAANLSTLGSSRLTQDTAGIPSAAASGEAFGDSLAAGKFARYAPAGLAIGASGEIRPGFTHFFAGGPNGVDARRNQLFTGRAEGLLLRR